MAVSSLIIETQFTADGVLTSFAPTFPFQANSQLKVYVDGVLKTISTDYTLTGAPASAVNFNSAPANGAIVLLKRITPLTQTLNLVENGSNPVEDTERALDRLLFMIQELEARVAELES